MNSKQAASVQRLMQLSGLCRQYEQEASEQVSEISKQLQVSRTAWPDAADSHAIPGAARLPTAVRCKDQQSSIQSCCQHP